MKIELFSVKDVLVGFSQPIACVNEAVALRQFIGSCRAQQPNICNTFPENKEFWKLGTLDDETGELKNDLKFLARASNYVEQSPITTPDVATKKEEGEER